MIDDTRTVEHVALSAARIIPGKYRCGCLIEPYPPAPGTLNCGAIHAVCPKHGEEIAR